MKLGREERTGARNAGRRTGGLKPGVFDTTCNVALVQQQFPLLLSTFTLINSEELFTHAFRVFPFSLRER